MPCLEGSGHVFGWYKCERRNISSYPAFAVPPMLASPAVFPSLCSSSFIRAFNSPISSACFSMVISFSESIFFKSLFSIYAVLESFTGVLLSVLSISPRPVNNQVSDISGQMVRIFSNLSLPMDVPFLMGFANAPFDMPNLRSTAAIVSPLDSMYCFNLSSIHEKILR